MEHSSVVLEKSERALVDAAKGGDEAAFRALIEPLSRELSAYAYRMVGGYQDAEDALQETRLKAWRHLASSSIAVTRASRRDGRAMARVDQTGTSTRRAVPAISHK